jgi:hypothetical protein
MALDLIIRHEMGKAIRIEEKQLNPFKSLGTPSKTSSLAEVTETMGLLEMKITYLNKKYNFDFTLASKREVRIYEPASSNGTGSKGKETN